MSHASINNEDTALCCVHCCYPRSDVVFGCPSQCAYHARCLDLASVQQNCLNVPSMAAELGINTSNIKTCLHCKSEATSLEILPLAIDSIKIGRSESFVGIGKRSFYDDSLQPSQGYDLNTPRTGRWVPSEISFRDALITHFTSGSLPLRDEYKLLDFLSDILKSKQSRLTKKMKHANLSVQHYCYSDGYLPQHQAVELSRLEEEFIGSLPDQEAQELKFHMSRLWREHLADRLSLSKVPFDPNRWIESTEILEKRLADKQEQDRMVKRRIMMGKAWQVDSKREEGVFVNGMDSGDDFESFISLLESENNAHEGLTGDNFQNMFTSFANGTEASETSGDENTSSLDFCQPSPSSSEPNFRFAAPFLAWIISYMERTNIPFEHVDIWCPSSLPNDVSGAMAPPPSTMGSGVCAPPNCRLYFAGAASCSKQMLPLNNEKLSCGHAPLASTPMSSEEIESLSLFGDYSQKFSFSNGCGLPGRVFQSGQPEVSLLHPYLFYFL